MTIRIYDISLGENHDITLDYRAIDTTQTPSWEDLTAATRRQYGPKCFVQPDDIKTNGYVYGKVYRPTGSTPMRSSAVTGRVRFSYL